MTDHQTAFHHITVLSQPLIDGIQVVAGGHYLDVTVGGGGHSERILRAFPDTTVLAIDRDQQALAAAQNRLAVFCDRIQFWQGNFADYEPGTTRFNGIIADLGVNSVQLDQADRGFSFRHDAPLDMRMDQRQAQTAADLINYTSEKELADIFYHYGEERYSRRIARQIVAQRPFQRTQELAAVVARAIPAPKSGRRPRIHPATRVFQAIRIAVNAELSSLETLIAKAPDWLLPSGVIGVISFHSLEDRIVKHQLRGSSILKIITKKPITPTASEIQDNPRARSAKLRLARRLDPSLSS